MGRTLLDGLADPTLKHPSWSIPSEWFPLTDAKERKPMGVVFELDSRCGESQCVRVLEITKHTDAPPGCGNTKVIFTDIHGSIPQQGPVTYGIRDQGMR